jgi:hypothetical protein
MSDLTTEQRRGLPKIQVACKTCGISESFYSNLSVEKFKARHSGHEVTDGSEKIAPEKPQEEQAIPEERDPVVKDGREGGTKVAKVIVDLLDFPSLDSSIFRVRGFDVNLDEAFTATMSSVESTKVREMLATGEYFDRDATGLLFFWEPDVVEYVNDVKDKLGPVAEALTEAKSAQHGPSPSESEEVIDQATVNGAAEVLIDTLSNEETRRADDGTVSTSLYPFSDPSERVEDLVPPLAPQSAPEMQPEPEVTEVKVPSPPISAPQSAPEMQPEPEVTEVKVPSQRTPAKREEKKAVKKAVKRALSVASAPTGEAKEDNYLLVSKSWYIQGGAGNRKEAVRVSKVLKAFRWKVEPIYTIGVILDDMLSIETSRSQISGTLMKRIEGAGYRLTAVAIDQGKPVAWFKREGSEMHPLLADSVASGLDDPETELESDVTG